MKTSGRIDRRSRIWLGIAVTLGLAVGGSALAQTRTTPAAARTGPGIRSTYRVSWNGNAGYMYLVEDDGIVCGDYFVHGSYGWISGTLANNTITGLWDGEGDGGGGLVLNLAGNTITGTSGDTPSDTTGNTLTGTRAPNLANLNFGRRWEGHWNGDASTLTLTQRGNSVTGTASGSWSGPIEGTVSGSVLVARYTDTASNQRGRFVMRLRSDGTIVGAISSDRTACFGSWELDYHQ